MSDQPFRCKECGAPLMPAPVSTRYSVCPEGCGRLLDIRLPITVARLNCALIAGVPTAQAVAGQPGLWVLPGGEVYRRVRAFTRKIDSRPRMPEGRAVAITDGKVSELEFDPDATQNYRGAS